MADDRPFKLAAILMRGKSPVRFGVNSFKTHPGFARTYRSGDVGYCLHAEMDALRFAKPGDELVVMRWKNDGVLTMSKPCAACMKYIMQAKIRRLTYTDWDGNFHTIKLPRS